MNTEQVQEIFVEDIIPNRFQPRLTFDEKALQELSDSIKQHGVIQPLVLRKTGNKYEIIAGERRYKASCMAGLKKVPAIVREMTDNESAEVALIENVQRKNLTSIEEAQSYKNLLDRGYLTQGELAQKIGVSQPTIANKMRLLNLCDEVQNALLNEQISERHARSLLSLADPDAQKMMLNRIIKERLTVKQLDNEIKKYLSGDDSTSDRGTGKRNERVMTMNHGNENAPGSYESSTKNIFGINVETPTDLETSAPNLNTTIQDDIPPISFNPFATNTETTNMATQTNNFANNNSILDNASPYSENGYSDFNATGNYSQEQNLNPFSGLDLMNNNSSSDNSNFDSNFSQNESINPVETTIDTQLKEESNNMESSSLPIETFDMFGDIVEPTTEVDNADLPEQKLSFGDEINKIRDAVKSVEADGHLVEMEEYDFEDMYQMKINIKKDTNE